MPHIPQVKTNLSGQTMSSISRGVFSASSAALPVQGVKTGTSWRRVTPVPNGSIIRQANGRWVVFTGTTTGYTSTTPGDAGSWQTITFPMAVREGIANTSGKWVFYSGTYSGTDMTLTNTTDFVSFATPYTQTMGSGSQGVALFGGQGIDYEPTMGKWAIICWGGNPGKILSSSSGNSGSWTVDNIASTTNPYAVNVQAGANRVYVAPYGEATMQYANGTFSSWTKTSSSTHDCMNSQQSINKSTGQVVNGSNTPGNGYWSGNLGTLQGRTITNSRWTGSSWNSPAYIGGGTWMMAGNTSVAGQIFLTTTTPDDPSSWSEYTNGLATSGVRFAGNQTDGWVVVGLTDSTIYLATS
jgi:hypothetical protein